MFRKGSNLDYQDNQILDTIRNQYREDIRSPELKHGGKNRGRHRIRFEYMLKRNCSKSLLSVEKLQFYTHIVLLREVPFQYMWPINYSGWTSKPSIQNI